MLEHPAAGSTHVVSSLLAAIVRADGDALVMHVGERPYVVAPAGPVELSARPLTLEAVAGMLGQLLPPDTRRALDELGAIEHELPRLTPGERFTVVAARGGDDIWIEIRRHRAAVPGPAAEPEPPPAVFPPAPEVFSSVSAVFPPAPEVFSSVSAVFPPAPAVTPAAVPAAEAIAAVVGSPPPSPAPFEQRAPLGSSVPPPTVQPAPAPRLAPVGLPTAAIELSPPAPVLEPPVSFRPVRVAEPVAQAPRPASETAGSMAERAARASEPARPAMDHSNDIEREFERLATGAGRPAPIPDRPSAVPDRPAPAAVEPVPAVVLPLARNPVRQDAPTRTLPPARIAGIDRLLRLAAARGANTLYLMSQGRPSIRVDGEIAALEGEPVLAASEVESLLLDLAPERNREALRHGEGTEWMSEVPDVGRFRCQSFRDHRGPGGIFRMISTRPTGAEQLGLSREIQALCAEPEGLILVAGPRSSGKSTLISALVDLINRTRNDYVVTIESQIKCVHESRGCLISQREVRGNNEETAGIVRAAMRENPDVLVVEDLRSPGVLPQALEAMDSGHLVIGAVAAHTSTTAIGRILDQFSPERRPQIQMMLSEGLRGVVSQVLLRKTSGGRVAARELLLNTPSIASLIAEGRISQLPLALDSGRKHGMVPLNDALAAFVQSGAVDVKDAYRKAFERPAFLAVLRREGVDTSFVERLA